MRTPTRLLHRTAASIAIALLAATGATAATAGPVAAKVAPNHAIGFCTPHTPPQTVNTYIAQLRQGGASQSTIDADLAGKFNLTRTSPASTAPAEVGAQSVHIPAPAIYEQEGGSCGSEYWYVVGNWNWTNAESRGDHADEFSIEFNDSARVFGQSLCYWGNSSLYPEHCEGNAADGSDGDGVGFTFDNASAGIDTAAYNGQEVLDFDRGGVGCASMYAKEQYEHTWNGVGFDSFSFSLPASVTVNVSNHTYAWGAQSPAGNHENVC